MALDFRMNYCGVCGKYLGMENFDGICDNCNPDDFDENDYSYIDNDLVTEGWNDDEDDWDIEDMSSVRADIEKELYQTYYDNDDVSYTEPSVQ